MSAILPAIHIEADAKVASYFLDYQLAWIADTSRMMLAEKSVRIGWTFADAFRNVRKRILNRKRDYLFQTKDQQSSIEYLKICKQFAEIFNLTRSILSHGEDTVRVQSKRENGETFTEEVKFGYILFDNGSRIIAFSSNPQAMAVFEGDVGLDEFAKHQAAEKLWETAQGRITWGYDIGVWSAHDGTDTLFYQFAKEAEAGKGGWTHYRVTMEDAVELGLVEKINATRGTEYTREGFIDDCKKRARLPEIYEQSYNCNPSGSASAIVPWSAIQNCLREYEIERFHLEASQVLDAFGAFNPNPSAQAARALRIGDFLDATFPAVFNEPARHRLGFDVAASGEGDLCAMYVERKFPTTTDLAALFTTRTDDWDFIECVLWHFHRRLSALQSAGDETGLGRQICWKTAALFPGVFTPINFASEKQNMGFALMNQLASGAKIMPRSSEHADIPQDFFSLRKIYAGKRWVFTEGRNLLNPESHCDIAWAGALAGKADEANPAPGTFKAFGTNDALAQSQLSPRQARRHGRALVG